MIPSELVRDNGIVYRKWCHSAPKAVILVVHGLGGHSARWESLADFFALKNISTYAIELRGFGETKDISGHIESFGQYLKDLHYLYSVIKNENPDKEIFLLGESLGAIIAFLSVIEQKDSYKGFICISPAFKSSLKFSVLDYIGIFFSLIFKPTNYFNVRFNSRMCTRDIYYQKIMDSDPRERRLVTAKFLFNALMAQIRCKKLKQRINIPVLFLLSGKDFLVDSEESKKIFDALSVKDKSIQTYYEMYHALSIDSGNESVFEDIAEWIKNRI